MSNKEKTINKQMLLIIAFLGLIYLRSGWGKISGGQFIAGLPETLSKFSSKNPYPWIQSFLKDTAIPNSVTFGFMTMWGELLVALALILSAAYILASNKNTTLTASILIFGLIGGMFLNAVFWFSAGWTSASTDSVNLVMFFVELVGVVYVLKLLKA